MTRVFFFVSFPYNNANLEKSLRAELQKQGFSLVYCQNILSHTPNLPPLYKHAQCRSFLLWENPTENPTNGLIPAVSSFQQLHKWSGSSQRISVEQICSKYNGELFAAVLTTQASGTCKETSLMLSPEKLRSFLRMSVDEFCVHLSLEKNLQALPFLCDSLKRELPFVLEHTIMRKS